MRMEEEAMHVRTSKFHTGGCRLLGRDLVTLVGVLLAVGCGAPRANWSPKEHSCPPLVMKLLPGDELDIKFLGAPQLDTLGTVSRDGNIALRLVGQVKAAGKTVRQLQDELTKLYASQIQVQEITIIVRTPAPVFVTGSVLVPGRKPMTHPMTALEAIMEAGGPLAAEAELRSVVVIRHAEGVRRGYLLNLKPILNGETDYPFYLEPFDIVYVPRTCVTKVNQWVDQYINRMLPRLGLGYTTSGETTFVR
jgi:polysaccharide export outer membrane protein